MNEDERFSAGADITIEIVIYLAAFFAAVAGSALAAHLDLSWPALISALDAITGD